MPTRKDIIARLSIMTPYLLLMIALPVLVWRSFYGFCWVDESFYVALADRLYDGAVPFYDEWHPAQVYAPLLLPMYLLYLNATGSTDGVILFFRLTYVLFSFFVALFSYRTLSRDFGRFASCAIALCYLFYVRANILGLSYYSLCTSFFLLGLICSWIAFRWHRDHAQDSAPSATRVLAPLCAGMFFALAIICNPYVIVIFFMACLFGLVYATARKRLALFVPFIWAIVGAGVIAACYLCFIFTRISPADLMANLGNILASHDENLTLAERIPNYLMHLPVTRVGFLGTVALVVILVAGRARGKMLTPRARAIIFCADAVLFLYTCLVAFFTSTHPNAIFIAFTEFAVPCYLMADSLRPSKHPELFLFWIPGILLSLVWQFSSNTQICGIIIGYSIAAYGAIITVLDTFAHKELPALPQAPEQDEAYGRELLETRMANALHRIGIVLVVVLVAMTAAIRLASVYSDCAFSEMSTTIETGPAAGLHTSEVHAEEYEGIRDLVAHIDNDNGVWVVPMEPWAYLETPGACAAPSAWNTFVDRDDWDAYYETQGHETPGWILVAGRDVGTSVNIIAGREKAFPALEMYYDYDAALDSALEQSDLYKPLYSNRHGTLYKRVEFSSIQQGS